MVPASSSQQRQTGWEVIIGPYDRWLRQRVRHTMRRKGLRPWSEDVLDHVQEVYCRLLEGGPQRLGRLRELRAGEMFAYLGKVVDGVVHDRVRAASALKRTGDRRHAAHPGGGRKLDLEDPERLLLRSERRRLLLRTLADAAAARGIRQRSVRIFWLAFVEDWRSRDIARVFRVKPRSVDTLLSSLRRRFRRQGVELRRRVAHSGRYDAA